MADDSSTKLENTLRRLVDKARGRRQAREVGIAPGCAYGMIADERLRLTEREVRELKGRINGLLFLLIALVIAELVVRLVD